MEEAEVGRTAVAGGERTEVRGRAEGDATGALPSYLERLQVPLVELIKIRLRKTGEGGRVGRYVILRLLGEGGMGTVFSAYDEELDRKVAIKLLRADGPGGPVDRAWLLGEAKAMARLSHPNVVQIYDVGEFDDPAGGGQVFIAMELVTGVTLGRWLRDRPRERAAILDALVQAGEGLAAVHAAGMIHRDFKPANVLVGDDGRVRVLDFGLAHRPTDASQAAEATGEGASSQTHAGTPAYMAPEQHALGREIDARADVFAFGVALHEALYGQRPFVGASAREVIAAVVKNERSTPADVKVPAHLRRIVDRALQPDPAARYPSMPALLRDLRRDPWRTRGLVIVVGGLSLALAITLGLLARERAIDAERDAAACAGGAARIAEAWGPSRREAAARAFAATGLPYAEDTWSKVQARLDAYSREWAEADRQSCEERRVGALTDNLYERSIACLDGARRDLAALTRVYADADAKVAERAIKASEGLPPLEGCRDRQALVAGLAPLDDAGRAAKVGAIRDAVAEITAEVETSHTERCGALEGSEAAAVEVGYRPLVAEVSHARGRCAEVAGEYEVARGHYHRALTEALASGHDRQAIASDIRLAYVAGLSLGKPQEGGPWLAIGQAIAERTDPGDFVWGRILLTRGAIASKSGRLDEARVDLERALEILRREHAEGHSALAIAVNNLAIVHAMGGRQDQLIASFEEALELSRRYLGPDHPDTLTIAANLSNALFSARHYARADVLIRETLARKVALSGPEHPDVALMEMNLGAIIHRQASVAGDRQGLVAAREHLARAVAIRERSLGAENPRTAFSLMALGEVDNELGDHRSAEALLTRARAVYDAGERDNPDRASALTRLGRTYVALGRAREALPLLDEAARIVALGQCNPEEAANSRFRRAVALAAVRRGERAEARALAEEALAFFRGGGDFAGEVREIEAWLAALPG